MKKTLLLTIAASTLLLAACGGSENGSSEGSSPESTSDASAASAALDAYLAGASGSNWDYTYTDEDGESTTYTAYSAYAGSYIYSTYTIYILNNQTQGVFYAFENNGVLELEETLATNTALTINDIFGGHTGIGGLSTSAFTLDSTYTAAGGYTYAFTIDLDATGASDAVASALGYDGDDLSLISAAVYIDANGSKAKLSAKDASGSEIAELDSYLSNIGSVSIPSSVQTWLSSPTELEARTDWSEADEYYLGMVFGDNLPDFYSGFTFALTTYYSSSYDYTVLQDYGKGITDESLVAWLSDQGWSKDLKNAAYYNQKYGSEGYTFLEIYDQDESNISYLAQIASIEASEFYLDGGAYALFEKIVGPETSTGLDAVNAALGKADVYGSGAYLPTFDKNANVTEWELSDFTDYMNAYNYLDETSFASQGYYAYREWGYYLQVTATIADEEEATALVDAYAEKLYEQGSLSTTATETGTVLSTTATTDSTKLAGQWTASTSSNIVLVFNDDGSVTYSNGSSSWDLTYTYDSTAGTGTISEFGDWTDGNTIKLADGTLTVFLNDPYDENDVTLTCSKTGEFVSGTVVQSVADQASKYLMFSYVDQTSLTAYGAYLALDYDDDGTFAGSATFEFYKETWTQIFAAD